MAAETKKPEFTIREMLFPEYETVMRLWAEAGLPYKPQGRDAPDRVRAERERGCAFFLVAEAGGELVGAVIGTHDGRKGWVNRLAVVPKWRRRGVGRRLVEAVEARLAERGIEIVAALVETANTPSLRLFAELGYLHDPGIAYFSKRKSPKV